MAASGNWYRYGSKATTESQIRIDIRWLKKQGYLHPGVESALSWTCRGKQAGTICFRMEVDCMILNYRQRPSNGEWEPVSQTIAFGRTFCNYGGHRTWFLCKNCGRRVALLYGAGKYFLCRHCYNLTYSSQQENRSERLMRKGAKIRERLGVNTSSITPIIFKPKNMHWKTFNRLRIEAENAELRSWLNIGKQWGII